MKKEFQKIEYTLVSSAAELQSAVEALARAETLAVDTEFVGEKYYSPRLELMQIGDGERIWLVDAEAIDDLSPLGKVLGDESKLKLFHAADQDLELLQRELGCRALPMFDTQVAASLLGYGAQISLVNLTSALLDIALSGKQTTSDWSARPLNEEQLAYAASDVLHLHELYRLLRDALVARGRFAWYVDEQAACALDILDAPTPDPMLLYRRVKDWMSLSPKELAVLRELTLWRENTARQKNQPRRSIFTDDGLIEMARFQPANRDKAKTLRRVNQGQVARFFDEVLAAIERGKKIPRDQWPEKPVSDRPDIPAGLLEICQAMLRIECDRAEVASSVVATTSDLSRLISSRRQLDDPALDIPLLSGWRRQVVGQRLTDLLKGRITIRVDKDGELVFAEEG